MITSLLIHGDARKQLSELHNNSIECAITSPPYWGLRDYDVDGQIGLETDLNDYITNLVETFRLLRNVLKKDGTFWLNMGDSYSSYKDRKQVKQTMAKANGYAGHLGASNRDRRVLQKAGLKDKDICGIPWMLALALRADGWYLRSDIIWNKPDAMPESVKDRPTRAHEYLFLLTKSKKYYYNHAAIADPTRNKRSVWNINKEPYPGAHFATFPQKLVEPCILAGCPPNGTVIDPFCGSGTVGIVAAKYDRNFIGIELNPKYIEMTEERIRKAVPSILITEMRL